MVMTDDDGQMGAHTVQGRFPAYYLEQVSCLTLQSVQCDYFWVIWQDFFALYFTTEVHIAGKTFGRKRQAF